MPDIVCGAFITNQQVLLVRRASHRKWSPNCWDLVGGHVEKGEEVAAALIRECQEEVGLTPISYTLLATIYEADDASRKNPFHIFVITQWVGGTARLLGDEHSELGWFRLDDLGGLHFAMYGYRPIILKLLQLS
ncbi:NUDIX hydrolase [Rhizobium sp. BK251]|uniref:NUDIX hydrolase n=1 Tax=Rhizobium sp. BK251 TaxID=2512125 RepID=UPI001042D38F|nr:NUDIX hydrolase [Rhizobium sp. BK251]TCL63258.1 ADP-ribose pyrophosphatase YjhB (NUDIX family) [Rhizobium sp. BK251]